MDQPELGCATGDHLKVMRWLTASEQYYKEKFPELSDKQWRNRAMDYCLAVSPYGRRYAVHQMNVPIAQLPQFEFPLQEEQNFEGYIAARRSEALSSATEWSNPPCKAAMRSSGWRTGREDAGRSSAVKASESPE